MACNIKRVLHLLYPPLCAHCQCPMAAHGPLFCTSCNDLLSLLEWKGRCPVCFLELGRGACQRCRKRRVIVHRQSAAIEPLGPGRTLLNLVEQGEEKPAQAAAALMAYQYLKLQQELPDWIIPMPASRFPEYLPSAAPLAKALAKILSVPVAPCLFTRLDWSRFLSTGKLQNAYRLRGKCELADRRLLLCGIRLEDDRFRQAATALQGSFPARIAAIAFSI